MNLSCVRPLLVPLVAAILIASAPAGAEAQDMPRASLSARWALLTDSLTDETLPAGWVVDGALRMGRVFVVLEAGGQYTSLDSGEQVRVHGFLGGLRLSGRRASSPFVQLLTGVACYCATTVTLGDASNRWTLQPGAGVDLPLRDRWTVRLQGDYRWVAGAGGDDGSQQFRAAAGLTVWFGE